MFLRPRIRYEHLLSRLSKGGDLDVVGILEQHDTKPPFSSGYRLRPRGVADITFVENAGTPWLVLALCAIAAVVGAGFWLTRRSRRGSTPPVESPAEISGRQAQRMQALGTLAGGIAHDFNNYLLAITGYTELARDDLASDSPIRESLDEVLNASDRAKGLVEQILSFSKQADDAFEPLDASRVLVEGLRLLRAVLPASIVLRERIDPDCGRILADQGQLYQLLLNLGTNAVHAMQEEGGTLTVSLEKVELNDARARAMSLKGGGAYLRLSSFDTGSGMDAQTLKRIFDPFFTTKDPNVGTGLGLSVVHGIVHRHRGAIQVESEVGRGTTFHLFFRVLEESAMETTEESFEPEPESVALDGRGHVLLVDDHANLSELGRRQLEGLGFTVTSVSDSAEALALFRSRPEGFDLVVTDQTMPKVTGIELIRRCREVRPDVPVLLTTGFSETVTDRAMADAGIDVVLMKPYSRIELARSVQDALRSTPRAS